MKDFSSNENFIKLMEESGVTTKDEWKLIALVAAQTFEIIFRNFYHEDIVVEFLKENMVAIRSKISNLATMPEEPAIFEQASLLGIDLNVELLYMKSQEITLAILFEKVMPKSVVRT